MAQQDTGLGWNAKSEWLIATAGAQLGNLSKYQASGYANQPLAYCPTEADVKNSGTYVGATTGYPSQPAGRGVWVGSNTENAAIFVSTFTTPGGNKFLGLFSSVANFEIRWAVKRYSDWYRSDTVAFTGEYDSTTGLYFASWGFVSAGLATYGEDVFPYEDAATVIVAIETPYYKLNEGYAVAAMVTWVSLAGDNITTPLLISSERDAVILSADGSTEIPDQMISSYLYDGIRFYMSFLNLRDFSFSSPNVQIADLTQFAAAQPSKVFSLLVAESYSNIQVSSAPDPYEEESGASGEDGGDGDEIVDDDVDFTPLPSSMAVASGFITLFCPSQYELNQLANYMWSPLFDVDTFKKLFANPMDCILGLAVYPFPISASGTKTVSVGGIATTVSMGYTLQQYHIVDCGSVYVPKQWGAYMDYAPYTRFNIFLPYIGFRSISADDIMGKTISLRYMVDILSGACNAELKCGSTVLYSWAGSCAAQIPITGNDWRSAITAGISIAGSVAATVLTQGASAPMIAGTIASAAVNSTQLKPEVQRSGSISGSSGFLAGQRPYLVRTNPRSAIPANQNKYSGYPSFVTILLGSLTGYNEVYSIHLENIPATGAELDEIESILKGGAIF